MVVAKESLFCNRIIEPVLREHIVLFAHGADQQTKAAGFGASYEPIQELHRLGDVRSNKSVLQAY